MARACALGRVCALLTKGRKLGPYLITQTSNPVSKRYTNVYPERKKQLLVSAGKQGMGETYAK